MSGIFITYRRDDSLGFAGRLDDDLTERFGDALIFRDREISPGEHFGDRLRRNLALADVALAVIGPRWTDVRDADGNRRLDHPDDWVRLALETALGRGIPVVPVLVAGARMPAAEHLPESLADFSHRQAFSLSDRRWRQELDELALQLARLSPVLRDALRRRGVTGTRGDVADAIRDVGHRAIDEAVRRSGGTPPAPYSRTRVHIASFARKLRKLLASAALAGVLYFVIRRAGGPELNALLDRLLAILAELVRSVTNQVRSRL